MEPTIHEGDELLVTPQVRSPRFGDVVVFAYGDKLVAHRVIRSGGRIVTAGDASRGMREFVEPREILGTAVKVCRAPGTSTRLYSPVRAILLRARLAVRFQLRKLVSSSR
jgi:hypothetical protein